MSLPASILADLAIFGSGCSASGSFRPLNSSTPAACRAVQLLIGAELALGASLIAYVMFVSHRFALETIGFAVLIAGVAFEFYHVYRAECLPRKERQAAAMTSTAASSPG